MVPTARYARALVLPALLLSPNATAGQTPPTVSADAERRIEAVLKPVIAWRRDLHEHPELGLQETRTSKLIADHLRALGLEVQVGVPGAATAVVGVLKGARPGPVVALRADMDASAGHRAGGPALQVDAESDVERPAKPASCTPAATTTTWPS